MFASFIAVGATGKPVPLVLSAPVTLPGTATAAKLPAPSAKAVVDGYSLFLSGMAMVGMQLTLNVTITRDGKPVTSLQPYLARYAHLTAFGQGSLMFAHLHPSRPPGITGSPPDLPHHVH